MEKKILLFFVLGLFLIGSSMVFSTDSCVLSVSLINQDPYPAAPNSYVKLVFQVSGVENPSCEGVKFEFVPAYPFSLDENEEALKELDQGSTYISSYSNNWMIAYKVRVDKDAIEGDSEVKIRYAKGGPNPYIENKFVVNIEDTRTSFDAVIQDVSASEVSIALANVGKYTANSVVVRIPEQEDFRATKTSGQMVGNLESGDYTLASFELTRNVGENAKMTPKESTLKFEIHYTDSIGERRVVNMELPLMTSYFLTSNEISGQVIAGGKFAMRQPASTPWWQYALIVVVALFLLRMIYKRFSRKRLSAKSDKNTPDWLNEEKKE